MFAADIPPAHVQTEHLQVELVAADRSFTAGARHWLGLRLRHAPHWHTYWRNPGDSGLPTRTLWTLPAGVSVGAQQWPAPTRYPVGGLYNFGYDGEQFLPIEISLDPALQGDTVRLSVDVSWLVCEEECIPGKATLGLERPLATTRPQADQHAAAIEQALASVPQTQDWPLQLHDRGGHFELELRTDALQGTPELFPVQPQVLANAAPVLEQQPGHYRWTIDRSDYFVGLPQPFEMVLKDPVSQRSYVLSARSPSPQP